MPPKRTTTTTRKARTNASSTAPVAPARGTNAAATRRGRAQANGPIVPAPAATTTVVPAPVTLGAIDPTPTAPVVPAPIAAGTQATDPTPTGALVMPDVLALQAELQTVKDLLAQAQIDNAAANSAVAAAAGHQVNLTPVATIPKPQGSAGGGKKGFHLQEEMGLDGTADGRKKYTMILATVRELIHATRVNPYRTYRMVSAEDLAKIFQSARRIHPYLNKFDGDWATAEIVKQYLSSVRRYGRRMGYITEPDAEVGLPPIDQMA